jgi:hypothetical protein
LRKCLFFALVLVATGAFAETRRAVVIGIDKYVPGSIEGGPDESTRGAGRSRDAWGDLDGSVNDAEEFAALLEGNYGFEHQNITILRNRDATRENILATIRHQLIEPSKKGDVAVWYYAGHGSQMKDSASKEADKLDETIVPVDGPRGAVDIRDKEISRLLNDMLDKGAIVTAIFDSCHSGSISRGYPTGKARYVLPDTRDVVKLIADKIVPAVDAGPEPETRGALILSASSDTQVAGETEDEHRRPHGLFTAALLHTLRTAPRDESIRDIMKTVQSTMDTDARGQRAEMAGPLDTKKAQDRFAKPLLGVGTVSANGKTRVGGHRLDDPPNQFRLDGGSAIGLEKGAELLEVTSEGEPIRLQIDEVNDLSHSTAKVIAGKVSRIKQGALFEVTKWIAPDHSLRVWWDTSGPAAADLVAATNQVASLAKYDKITWVTDTTVTPPTYVVRWNGKGWSFTNVATGVIADLGPTLDSSQILQRMNEPVMVARAASSARAHALNLFVDFPPPQEMVKAIKVGQEDNDAAIRARDAGSAHYILQGRVNDGALEYAWVIPNLVQAELSGPVAIAGKKPRSHAKFKAAYRPGAPLPPHTDWLKVDFSPAPSGGDDGMTLTAKDLTDFAMSLARVYRWREIQSPPDDGLFPYHLAFKNADAPKTAVVKSGPFMAGERYHAVLTAATEMPRHKVEQRYAYVFIVDSSGAGTLLFPPGTVGNSENQVPYDPDAERYPAIISLGGDKPRRINIGKPYGTDTYYLLTSVQPIEDPSSVFNFKGVIRGAVRGPGGLAGLVRTLSRTSRGANNDVPMDWSIERLTIESKAPAERQ